ncbi:G-D-S-L family lipolytic protein [Flavobacterium facile]|uniref:G-D-S-L family lipolytic protein n=1 Tax=Flavobacterium facile TaxID=2893174 RepID=UPI002E7A1608|nr:G-D-S-L family lipolytic protein [Flavobacterium sp. T-12]
MKNKFILLATLAIGFAGCEPEFENEVTADYTSGDANFSSYVAIGNSLTAGYMDGTVSKGSQMNSYPNLLAQQFALVGGGAFTQPSYADDTFNRGGLKLGGIQISSNRLVINADLKRDGSGNLVYDANKNPTANGVQPIGLTAGLPSTIEISAGVAGPYNNMGVPGAKSFHLLSTSYGSLAGVALGTANPYFVRQASSPTASILGDAVAKTPTFFTNWIGSNDVLAYATAGGAQSNGTSAADDHNSTGNMNPASYGGNDITNSTAFKNVYGTIINTLTVSGAKGVVCTIPSVTSIPYFTTVPYAPFTVMSLGNDSTKSRAQQSVVDQQAAGNAKITSINSINALLDGIFTAYGEPNRVNLFTAAGPNPLLITDVDAVDRSAEISGYLQSVLMYPPATAAAFGSVFGKARQATSADLIVLPASGIIGTVNSSAPAQINLNGITYPLANKWVLTANEKAKVAAATSAFNASIVSIANAKNTAAGKTVIAVADMNAIMNQLVTGLRIETGSFYTANYFSGSATEGQVLFSLDGVHPNARGYAVIANEIIKVINASFKSKLPLHNPTYFPGINILPTN